MPVITNEVASAQSMAMKFESNLAQLLELLGKSDVTVLPAGSTFNVYKTSGSLVSQQVGEGAEITASTYANALDHAITLSIKKYRKLTGVESVQSLGFEKAVEATNDAMERDVRATVKTSLFNGVKAGTGTATGATFQAAAANAYAALQVVAEDEDVTPIFFAHPTTAASYLGTAPITVQDSYGLKYVQNFLGMGTLIIDPKVTAAEVWATAQENINVIAPAVLSVEGAVVDETGCMSVSVDYRQSHAAYETVVLSGVTCELSALDHAIKATISA